MCPLPLLLSAPTTTLPLDLESNQYRIKTNKENIPHYRIKSGQIIQSWFTFWALEKGLLLLQFCLTFPPNNPSKRVSSAICREGPTGSLLDTPFVKHKKEPPRDFAPLYSKHNTPKAGFEKGCFCCSINIYFCRHSSLKFQLSFASVCSFQSYLIWWKKVLPASESPFFEVGFIKFLGPLGTCSKICIWST